MSAPAFDDTSGKWPAMAASLLVRLSTGLLQWQNPGEAAAHLLQALGAPISQLAGFFVTRQRAEVSARPQSELETRQYAGDRSFRSSVWTSRFWS
jgi:hypothetical protein